MADTVRYYLEKMVPELEELEEKGYFSREEIKEIVRRRENFEYSLKRRTPAKADFIRCLEFEKKLLEMMELRKAARHIKDGKTPANAACIFRCHEILERACRKFKADVSLWMAWLDFCKWTKSNKRMSKVLASALHIHPKAAGLWTYAAGWEFEGNNNPSAARSLMQQGLRACKNDPQLWLEYFKMELVHAEKLVRRREILGIGDTRPGEPKSEADNAEADEKLQNEAREPTQKALQAVLSGAIAGIVAREALSQIQSVELCEKLLRALDEHHFSGAEKIADEILSTMQEQMASSEEAWHLQARRLSHASASSSGNTRSPSSSSSEANRIYQAAIKKLPTPRMYDYYLSFLQDQVNIQDSKGSLKLKGKRKQAAKRLLEVYKQAAESGCLSAESAVAWPTVSLGLGDIAGAMAAAEQSTKLHPSSENIWLAYIKLSEQQFLSSNDQEKEGAKAEFETIISKALKSLKANCFEIWVQAAESALRLQIPLDCVLDSFHDVLATSAKGPIEGGMGQVAGSLVKLLWQSQSQQAGRDFYRRVLKLPAPGGDFFHTVLGLELDCQQNSLSTSDIVALFEAASRAYGKEDVVLWVRYAKFLEGTGKGYGSIAWRASKELNHPDEFVALMAGKAQQC